MNETFRKNVGIVVFNRDKKVLMCARADHAGFEWQFPQGGIDAGEDIIHAAHRELQEETGITSVRLANTIDEGIRYYFPPEVRKRFNKNGNRNVGQEQYWVLFYFYGDDSEIDFCTYPEEIEFKAYEWTDIEEAPERIITFKKKVYKTVAETFAPIIRDYQE